MDGVEYKDLGIMQTHTQRIHYGHRFSMDIQESRKIRYTI